MSNKGSIFYQYFSTNASDIVCTKNEESDTWSNTSNVCPNTNKIVCDNNFITSMCENKEVADKLYEQTYNGEDERYANTMSKYNTEVLNAFNLGMGIIISGLFIYTHRT